MVAMRAKSLHRSDLNRYPRPYLKQISIDGCDMSLFIALEFTVSLLTRTLVAQPYTIPSGSMMPTLEVGDYAVAVKFPYGYSNFSLPLGHVLPEFTYAEAPAK